ncbi:hypothetical protein [Nostoc edaphicum]|uniref:hypothetical protein n=1 Tax=Nostoc edaphicum TaxID=264686 RepID=UPI001EEC5CA1|nr:hypothetical protein [Nostoc edaphicum]
MSNSIMVIFPYRHNQTWVFDDERMELIQEPFVSGIPEMIDILVDVLLVLMKALNCYFLQILFLVIKLN